MQAEQVGRKVLVSLGAGHGDNQGGRPLALYALIGLAVIIGGLVSSCDRPAKLSSGAVKFCKATYHIAESEKHRAILETLGKGTYVTCPFTQGDAHVYFDSAKGCDRAPPSSRRLKLQSQQELSWEDGLKELTQCSVDAKTEALKDPRTSNGYRIPLLGSLRENAHKVTLLMAQTGMPVRDDSMENNVACLKVPNEVTDNIPVMFTKYGIGVRSSQKLTTSDDCATLNYEASKAKK